MQFIGTTLKDCYILEPTVIHDERGYFYEKFNQKTFEQLTGLTGHFVQDNISRSSYGVVRGLHLQKGEYAQAKLVSCLEGAVLDVAVDLRPHSPTFGKWFGTKLSEENRLQLYIPRGFAHGFSVLSDSAVLAYKCDNFYNREAEGGVRYDDPDLAIDWKVAPEKMIISEKDKIQPFLREINFK